MGFLDLLVFWLAIEERNKETLNKELPWVLNDCIR